MLHTACIFWANDTAKTEIYPEERGSKVLRNVGERVPNSTESCPRDNLASNLSWNGHCGCLVFCTAGVTEPLDGGSDYSTTHALTTRDPIPVSPLTTGSDGFASRLGHLLSFTVSIFSFVRTNQAMTIPTSYNTQLSPRDIIQLGSTTTQFRMLGIVTWYISLPLCVGYLSDGIATPT
jgi:hypothetical protein